MHIEIHALNKIYRGNVQALDNLDLTIPNGMYGLLGPNGAGKTTLMRILAGILRPTSGSLSIGSQNAATEKGRTAVKRILGYLPQELGVYPDLTAYEFLDYIGILKGLDDRQARKLRVNELLELVALSDVAKRRLKTFSGGMKRRVGIAQALLNDPELLIVDEPTAGLDPEERIRFRNMLADLGGNRIVLLSTHIVEDIAQTCQNLAIMRRGRVVFQGTVTDLVTATTGRVWTITTQGPKPSGDLTVVSTMNMGATVQYRVVGEPAEPSHAVPTQPSLEDGYIWLMRDPTRVLAQDGSINFAR
jgi:ABC-type multidrug transport system ATPase subunit